MKSCEAFCFLPITLGSVDLQQLFNQQNHRVSNKFKKKQWEGHNQLVISVIHFEYISPQHNSLNMCV